VEGSAPIISTYPKLAGQNKDCLVQQFKDIQSGARDNAQTSAMKGIVQGVSAADIDAIADYLSKR
jgi:cytochrome c